MRQLCFAILLVCSSACHSHHSPVDGAVPVDEGAPHDSGTSDSGAADLVSVPCDRNWASWPIAPDHPTAYVVSADQTTVTDTLTGLVWQRSVTGTYAWQAASDYCSALSVGAFGAGSWRLPNKIELESLADFGSTAPSSTAAIDATAFPQTPAALFWTASPDDAQTGTWWTINFAQGGASTNNGTSVSGNVRCVHATSCTSHAYTVAEQTVYDEATALEWDQTADTGMYTQSQAAMQCASLNATSFAGHTGWRLPTVRELLSLVDARAASPAIDASSFPGTISDYYWTSTAAMTGYAWLVDFTDGASGAEAIDFSPGRRVRCVRSGID